MKRVLFFTLLFLTSIFALSAQGGHEYAPLQQKEIAYKDWTYKNVKDNKPVNLREFTNGKKLVLVVYFAPWCHNWQNEAPIVAKLYEKYKTSGLDVIGVGEYASRDDQRNYFGPMGPAFTVVSESDSRDARDKTPHFGYRQKSGDTRNWGSPYNVILIPTALSASGDILVNKPWVANGELIEADAEKFIRQQLGLPDEVKPAAPTGAP